MNYYLINAIVIFFNVLKYAILARAILSFLPIGRDSMVIKIVYQFTEPILSPIRTLMAKSSMGNNTMLDFSPIIAFILLGIIQQILVRILV